MQAKDHHSWELMQHRSNEHKGLTQSETTSVTKKEKTQREDEQLSKISFIVLIVDIVPQKCHVRSHKSRAEITNSSYLSSCHSLHLLLLYTNHFLHLCINIYSLQIILELGWWAFVSPVVVVLLVENISREKNTRLTSRLPMQHMLIESWTPAEHTEPNKGALYTGMLSAIIHVVKKRARRGNMPTTREHRRRKCRKSPAAKALALFLFKGRHCEVGAGGVQRGVQFEPGAS